MVVICAILMVAPFRWGRPPAGGSSNGRRLGGVAVWRRGWGFVDRQGCGWHNVDPTTEKLCKWKGEGQKHQQTLLIMVGVALTQSRMFRHLSLLRRYSTASQALKPDSSMQNSSTQPVFSAGMDETSLMSDTTALIQSGWKLDQARTGLEKTYRFRNYTKTWVRGLSWNLTFIRFLSHILVGLCYVDSDCK